MIFTILKKIIQLKKNFGSKKVIQSVKNLKLLITKIYCKKYLLQSRNFILLSYKIIEKLQPTLEN